MSINKTGVIKDKDIAVVMIGGHTDKIGGVKETRNSTTSMNNERKILPRLNKGKNSSL